LASSRSEKLRALAARPTISIWMAFAALVSTELAGASAREPTS
jgi:hypothetical protein